MTGTVISRSRRSSHILWLLVSTPLASAAFRRATRSWSVDQAGDASTASTRVRAYGSRRPAVRIRASAVMRAQMPTNQCLRPPARFERRNATTTIGHRHGPQPMARTPTLGPGSHGADGRRRLWIASWPRRVSVHIPTAFGHAHHEGERGATGAVKGVFYRNIFLNYRFTSLDNTSYHRHVSVALRRWHTCRDIDDGPSPLKGRLTWVSGDTIVARVKGWDRSSTARMKATGRSRCIERR